MKTEKPLHHCDHVDGEQAPALHLRTVVAASQDVAPFLLRLENTNEMFHHLHCVLTLFRENMERKKKLSEDA